MSEEEKCKHEWRFLVRNFIDNEKRMEYGTFYCIHCLQFTQRRILIGD